MSNGLMIFLLVMYFIISVISLFEQNHPRALYWFGALIITASVLWMK